MALGALWEIGEFLVDVIFKTRNQYSLEDTMYDLIFDLFGAVFISILISINYKIMIQRYDGPLNGKKSV